ncbi:MAG TPA: hypothetical protein PLV68_20485, partial [Ilumatobacteraceae bacterium]|nr:hypothetical protein [Ilumatobacteraceae bacterium]
MRRIHPEPTGPVTLAEAYDVDRPPPPGRPWVMLCMIASIDGSTAVSGVSGGLGNEADRQLLTTLRGLADV